MAEFFTGDDWELPVTLKKNGSVIDVSSATINAAIVKITGSTPTEVIAATAQNSGVTGADWANGLVIVEFAAANTDITEYGNLYLELQVEMAGKKQTWPRQVLTVNKGIIA